MARYRKKPVVIEAVQWDGFNRDHVMALMSDRTPFFNEDRTVDIVTLEGTMTASEGDWIIRGVAGEIYPCKPDIFEATYEPAP